MFDPERQQQERKDLAKALRDLRRASGLSGDRLAVRCAMSQSKISRIECGKILPSVLDVERILTALEITGEKAKPFLDLARVANVSYKSWRAYAEIGLWRGQNELAALVNTSSKVRYFTPTVPSGMLQTRDYATAILTPTIQGRPARNIERMVDARIQRQEALHDASRTFVFVMTEHTIRWRLGTPQVMAAQCRHLAGITELPNVTIAVVPANTWTDAVPFNSFVIYDDRFVTIEMFSGDVVLRDPQEVSYHINIVDHFVDHALVGSDAADFLRQIATEF
jgi:transcriptional regulator with XRE-family HTH domain